MEVGFELVGLNPSFEGGAEELAAVGMEKSTGEWGLAEVGEEATRSRIFRVLEGFEDVFCKVGFTPGEAVGVFHSIETGEAAPIRRGPYPVPPARQGKIMAALKEMQDGGIVEPSQSPWSSGVVLVPKKDGSTRFCVDYRPLNAVTKKDAHPLPHIQEVVQSMGGNEWYCTLDLKSGYWQIPLRKEDREKTAFAVPGGGLW